MNMHDMHLEDMAARIKPRAASSLLLWSILGFIVLFLLWASFTKLDRTVHGAGRVVPTSQVQIVSNLEGGVISAILVKSGMEVKKGMPLVRLDQTATSADLGINQSAFDTLRAKVARLEAEISGRAPVFPVSSDPAAADQIQIERSLYLSRQSDLAALTAAGQARVAQAQRALAEAQASVAAAYVSRDAAKQQADLLRPLVANGIEPKVSLIQADRAAKVGDSQVAQANATLAKARAGIVEATAVTNQQRQEWRAKAGDELATAQGELASRQRALPALANKLDRTIVRAPLDGHINRVFVTTVGGTVRPAEPLVELIPADRALTVEARVTPTDIAFVRMGQRTLVKISAYDYSIYGGLEGEVVGISPDSTADEKSGQTFYIVRVRTKGVLKDQNGRVLEIGPGMTADVNLIGDKRTVMAYLLTPITRLSDDAFRER